jgi:hypothetical protein
MTPTSSGDGVRRRDPVFSFRLQNGLCCRWFHNSDKIPGHLARFSSSPSLAVAVFCTVHKVNTIKIGLCLVGRPMAGQMQSVRDARL